MLRARMKSMYFVTAALPRRWNSSALEITGNAGSPRLRCSSSLQLRVRARQLALEQHHFVFPAQRHQVNVAQAPGVVLLADAGRTGLRRRLLLEPRDELRRRLLRGLNRLLERGAVARGLLFEREQVAALLLDVADACDPQVTRIADEIELRLREQRRHALQLLRELRFGGGRQRKRVGPQLDDRVMRRPFVRRRVALRRPDRSVEGRIALPRLEHAQIEVETVHLGAQQLVVDLLRDRPRVGFDRLQARLIGLELCVLASERCRRVVRRAFAQRRPLEGAPLGEQRRQILVAAVGRCGACSWAAGNRSHDEGSPYETSRGGLKAHRFIIYSCALQVGGDDTMDLLTMVIILALIGTASAWRSACWRCPAAAPRTACSAHA